MVLGHDRDIGDDKSVAAMERNAHQVLDAAWELGVRHFDVARSYGRGEAFLATWLRSRDIAPDEVFVSSKWGYTYTAGWKVEAEVHEVKEHTVENFERQWPLTWELLGPWLDVYQVHSATLVSGFDEPALLRAMVQLRERTGVRLGLSVTGADQAAVVRHALTLEVEGEPVFSAVQATWNLLERSVGPALAEARDAGWLVTLKEGMANGRLTGRNPDPDQRARIESAASQVGVSPDVMALAASRSQPWADIVLSGASTLAHLRSNLQARELVWDDYLQTLTASLVEPAEQYWRTRSRLRWE